MSQCGFVGDYFEKNFYNQFTIKDEAIVISPEAVTLLNQIFENENNNNETSQFIKEIAIAEGLDNYVTDCNAFCLSFKSSNGNIQDIPIEFCCELTDQRIIDYITENQQLIFDALQFPEGKSMHLRRLQFIKVSKLKIEDNQVSFTLSVSIHVEEREDILIEQLGKNCIRYKMRKDNNGTSFFDITKSFYKELK